jgi:hypothetical protein
LGRKHDFEQFGIFATHGEDLKPICGRIYLKSKAKTRENRDREVFGKKPILQLTWEVRYSPAPDSRDQSEESETTSILSIGNISRGKLLYRCFRVANTGCLRCQFEEKATSPTSSK